MKSLSGRILIPGGQVGSGENCYGIYLIPVQTAYVI